MIENKMDVHESNQLLDQLKDLHLTVESNTTPEDIKLDSYKYISIDKVDFSVDKVKEQADLKLYIDSQLDQIDIQVIRDDLKPQNSNKLDSNLDANQNKKPVQNSFASQESKYKEIPQKQSFTRLHNKLIQKTNEIQVVKDQINLDLKEISLDQSSLNHSTLNGEDDSFLRSMKQKGDSKDAYIEQGESDDLNFANTSIDDPKTNNNTKNGNETLSMAQQNNTRNKNDNMKYLLITDFQNDKHLILEQSKEYSRESTFDHKSNKKQPDSCEQKI